MKATAAGLRERAARAKVGAYRDSLLREAAALERAEEAAREAVAGMVLEARLLAPEPAAEGAASAPAGGAAPAGWMPTPEELEDRPDFDPETMLETLGRFWRKDGLRVLQRKAKRGDVPCLRELSSLTRLLLAWDERNMTTCRRPCCKSAQRRRRNVEAVRVEWPSEADKA